MVSDRFERTFFKQSLSSKWELTYGGLKMFIASPTYGHGYSGYREQFADYFPDSSRAKYTAHNMFITALTNFGVIGFIPFLSIFFIPLVKSYKKIRQNPKGNNDHATSAAMICMTSIIPFMINGWFADIFFSNVISSILFSNVSLFLAVND